MFPVQFKFCGSSLHAMSNIISYEGIFRIFRSPCSLSVLLRPISVVSVIKKNLSIFDICNQTTPPHSHSFPYPCSCSFPNLHTSLVLPTELCGKNRTSHLLKVLFSSRRETKRNKENTEDLQNDIFLFPFHSPTQNSEEPILYLSVFFRFNRWFIFYRQYFSTLFFPFQKIYDSADCSHSHFQDMGKY